MIKNQSWVITVHKARIFFLNPLNKRFLTSKGFEINKRQVIMVRKWYIKCLPGILQFLPALFLVFWHSFSVSNNVNRLCLISLKIWNLDASQDRIRPHFERRTSYPWLAQPKNRGLYYIVVKRFDQKIGSTLKMFSSKEFQGVLVNLTTLWITFDSCT